MQSSPQSQFKWIIVYQCHHTKFVILRPMSSKRAPEVAFQLLDIFLIFGAPATFRVTTAQNSQPKSSQSSIYSATEELRSSCWQKAMFGEDPKVGLTSFSLPPEILKAGILSKKYSRNQFDLCLQRHLNDSDVNTESTITLCQALKSTASGRQGFFLCDCSKGKK